MANARRITVQFLGDPSDLVRASKKADDSVGKLGGNLKKVGKIAALGLAAGVVLGGKALADMTANASEDAAAQRRLSRALKNTTGATDKQVASVEDWISKQGKVLGVTDDELRPAFQKLVQATGDVEEAQRQMGIAMDVSAGTGKSLETVSAAMAKANNGTTASLSKLGLKTKDAEGNTLSLDDALKTMSDTFAGQATDKANTLEGKMGRLKLMFDETKETIGAKLIPIVTKLADWFLNKAIPAIGRFSDWFQDKLLPVIADVKARITTFLTGMNGDFSKNFEAIKSIVGNAVSIITSLWKTFGDTIIAFIKPTFDNVKNIISGAFKVIQGIFQVFSSLLKGDWKGVWDGIKKIVSGAWTVIKALVSQLWTTIKTVFRAAGIALKGIVSGIWSGIKGLFSAGVNAIVAGVRAIPGKLRALGGKFGDAGRALINAFVTGLKNAGGVISGIAGNVWDAVKKLLNGAIDKINGALEFKIGIPGPDIHINPPNIPHLAKGGIVPARRGGTLALLGEAGSDEAVIPLSGPHAPRMASGGGTTINIVINGALDPAAVGRQLEQIMAQYTRIAGRPLQVRTI